MIIKMMLTTMVIVILMIAIVLTMATMERFWKDVNVEQIANVNFIKKTVLDQLWNSFPFHSLIPRQNIVHTVS